MDTTDMYEVFNQHGPEEIVSFVSYTLSKCADRANASIAYRTGLLNAIAALKDGRPDDALKFAQTGLKAGDHKWGK